MNRNRYRDHRDNVITLYDRYVKKRGNQQDGVNPAFLKERVGLLKGGKYTLVVAGEGKAGKSTFINALLGAEILPSDVLQATSAIVEIFKSPTSFVKITYADGKTKECYDDPSTPFANEAKELLRSACSVQEKYRHIPFILLNKYIVSGITDISKIPIAELENQPGIRLDDTLPLIQEYLAECTLDKIPVEIQFGYPLEWEFDEFRLVDSPGVNALGCIQDKTFEYIQSANAILFVHPIKPVESQSFRGFFEKVISDRSRETLFLVLTHAGLYTDENVSKLHEEAKRLYSNIIPAEKILVVDSLLQLIHLDLKSGKTIGEIEASSEEKADLIPKFRNRAEKTGRDLITIIEETSRFDTLLNVINEFSCIAPALQLGEIVDAIHRGYTYLSSYYDKKVTRLEMKKKNPQEFFDEISRITNLLDRYQNLLFREGNFLHSKYMDVRSSWKKKIDDLKTNIPEKIRKSETKNQVEKCVIDACDAISDIVSEFTDQITHDLSGKLESIGGRFKMDHMMTVPVIDLKYIEETAKEEAYRQEDVIEDRTSVRYERRFYTLWLFKHKVIDVVRSVVNSGHQIFYAASRFS